jgi:hypothetical protein
MDETLVCGTPAVNKRNRVVEGDNAYLMVKWKTYFGHSFKDRELVYICDCSTKFFGSELL